MADDDDIDIYGDLANFGEKLSDDCSENVLELKQKCFDLENRVSNLEKELEKVRTAKNTLEVNLSSLVKTAKTEIARKDRMIGELRAELENTLFRRNNYRIPKINHRKTNAKNVSTVNTNQRSNNSTNTIEATETRVNNTVPVDITPISAIECKDNNGDCEDEGDGEIYQPNKFTSTIYGKRLKKKLMEQDEAEKLQKEQLKLAASTSVKAIIKDELETNSNNIHRDNKENQYHQLTPSEDKSENPTGKSLKRSNDEELNGHCIKRKKLIDHESESIDRRENENLGNMNNSASHELVNRKSNYRLERIEIQSRILIRRQDKEAATFQKNIDEERDNYRDKYHKQCSNSRSRSRDSSSHSDKRKDPISRRREYNRRRDTERLDYYRSGRDRDIQSKHEMHRDCRNRDVRYCSSGNERVIDLRNHIRHHRRQKNNTISDHRYDNRKRSGGLQHDRNDDYWKDSLRDIDNKKYEDRCKFSSEIFSDKSNDSDKFKKSNVETTSVISLEEGEIVGSPVSTPQKNRTNNVASNIAPTENPTIKILESNLLNTLSVETPEIENTGANYPKSIFTSPQEEKIENIEAFIRNFTCHEMSNNLSPTVTNDMSNKKTYSPCNTTKNIAETLGCEENEFITNECLGKDNRVQKCLNYDGEMEEEPLVSCESSSNIPQTKEDVNISSKSTVVKDETISINNISTSYADVLLKYARKKKNSSTSDSESTIPDKDSILIPVTIDTINRDENNCVENNTEKNSSVIVDRPQEEIPCKKSEALSHDTDNADGILNNAANKNEIDTVEIFNTKSPTVENATQLPNIEPHINFAIQKSDKDKNEKSGSTKKDEKLTGKNKVSISQCSNCYSEASNQVICTPINNQDGLLVTLQQTGKIQDKINDKIKKKNEPSKLEAIKCFKIPNEGNCKPECELDSSKNTTDTINECEKSLSNLTQSGKKIVVARRKKRPVQLTNSSSSLTVVLSAYSINNNRICKSKMKAPVTLSDT